MGNLVGYGRVSTRDQHPEAQRDALEAAGCIRVFIDTASGKLASRPQLDAALDFLREGDTLVITKLDRLGRSMKNLIEMGTLLKERKIGLHAVDQNIDTNTPGGMLLFHILGAIAEFERELMLERTYDGLAAARARGRVGGRKPALSPAKASHARKLYDEKGHTVQQIADLLGVSRATIYRTLEPQTDEAEQVHA